jgi:hypothetical protein
VKFFTDCLDDDSEKIVPKHGWDVGMVQVTSNKSHGLKTTNFDPEPFQSLMDLPRAIETVIQQNELKLYQGRSRKYSFAPPSEAAERKRAKAKARKIKKELEAHP